MGKIFVKDLANVFRKLFDIEWNVWENKIMKKL